MLIKAVTQVIYPRERTEIPAALLTIPFLLGRDSTQE